MVEPQSGLRVALAQVNPKVGDIDANADLVCRWIGRAREAGADLVLFPELVIPGYPAEDLYLKHHFAEANRAALERIARESHGIAAVVGFAEAAGDPGDRRPDAPSGRPVFNSAALLVDGSIAGIYRKTRLPNYGVFDEVRYFEAGDEPLVAEVAGTRVGLTVCEDLWEPGGPAAREVEAGAQLIVNASGSPYLRGKGAQREQMFSERARELGVPIAFCNLVGGQDELVFDGHSFVATPDGEIAARARQFSEDLLVVDTRDLSGARREDLLGELDEVYGALCLGVRDYVEKNGFSRVWVGLSGGIDSALVAVIAADALGAERLSCVVMPSPHSSDATQADARAIARDLGADLLELPIEPAMRAYDEKIGRASRRLSGWRRRGWRST